jgi:hypothetical protein
MADFTPSSSLQGLAIVKLMKGEAGSVSVTVTVTASKEGPEMVV